MFCELAYVCLPRAIVEVGTVSLGLAVIILVITELDSL